MLRHIGFIDKADKLGAALAEAGKQDFSDAKSTEISGFIRKSIQ